MTKVYSFISAKGGSGKTILTATIADFLIQLKKKVLIIDADGSTNGLSLFYLDDLLNENDNRDSEQYGIFEESYIYSESNFIKLKNGVKLIPATYKFRNTDNIEPSLFNKHLNETINSIKKNTDFDYILIDCQAGSDVHSEMVISLDITDEVVIVSEYDPISMAGVERVKGLFHRELTYGRTWVLLNKVLPDFADSNSDFLEISKYLSPILWDAEVVKKYARKELALDFDYGNEFTLSIIKLIRTLFGKSLKNDLTQWLKEKNEIIKKPIFEEYQKIKVQIEKYNDEKSSAFNNILFSLVSNILAMLGVVFTGLYTLNNNSITKISQLQPFVYGIIGVFITLALFSITRYFNKMKAAKKRNQSEIDILNERLKELELLKHSGIEKILKNKQKYKF